MSHFYITVSNGVASNAVEANFNLNLSVFSKETWNACRNMSNTPAMALLISEEIQLLRNVLENGEPATQS
jgi:hypothetical protein